MSVDALCESACMSLSDSCQLKTSKFSRMCAAAPAAGRESVSSRQQPEGRWGYGVAHGSWSAAASCPHDHCWHALEECNPAASNNRATYGIPCCAFHRSTTCAGLLPTRFAMSSTSGSSSSFGRIGGRNVVQS